MAARLTMVYPNGGEKLTLGSVVSISWTASNVNQNVKLVLLKDGGRLGIIADNLDPGGSPYRWTVGQYQGGTAPAGDGYQIRVRNMDNSLSDLSDSGFSLVASGSASLRVKQPNGGENWLLGESKQIQWDTDLPSGLVFIDLLRDGAKVGTIAQQYPVLAKSVNWNCGDILENGQVPADSGYKVRIRTSDNLVQDASDAAFTLGAQPAGTITISKPVEGETICRGRFYTGEWRATGTISQLELVAWINDRWMRLEGPFTNTGSIQYAVQADAYLGAFRLRLQTLDAACFDEVTVNVVDCGPSTYPDLTVTGARYEGNAVKAVVKNLGESYTGPMCLRPLIPAFGQLKDTIYPVRTIEKNGEWTYSLSVPAWPEGIECLPGSISVDPAHQVVESNEDNNRFNGPVCNPAWQSALPDFRVESFSYVSNPPGNYLIKLANDGAEFRGQVKVRVIAMDKLMGGELAYEKTVTTCQATFPAHGTYGFVSELVNLEKYPGVCSGAFGLVVDPGKEIPEANEKNNFLEQPFFSKEWGGNWRSIHPAEVRIGKSNLWLLQDGGTRVLPSEETNVSVPLRNCRPKGMDLTVVFRFDGSELARFRGIRMNAGESKAMLFTIHVPRRSELKPLAIHVLDEVHDDVNPASPDFQALVRVD